MQDEYPPTLYNWAGGMPALERLTGIFYQKVLEDPLLQPVFQQMGTEHPRYVAQFLAEVLGGPKTYSVERGGHPHMIAQHFVAYLEWGSRLAVINSQPGVKPNSNAPMPRWGWGEVGGPYRG